MPLVSHRTVVDAGWRSRARLCLRTRRQRTQRTRILEHGGFLVLPESPAFLSCFLPFIETDYKERRSQRQPVHRALVRPSPHPRCRARPRSQARGRASPAPRPPKCAANHRLVLGTCKTEKETCLSFATNPAQELLTVWWSFFDAGDADKDDGNLPLSYLQVHVSCASESNRSHLLSVLYSMTRLDSDSQRDDR